MTTTGNQPAPAVTADRLVELLHRPEVFPAGESLVEWHETHISWVAVTPTRAYKLKKPVRFDFLDFSTLDKRRQACEDELRLNRRLAPNVYQALVPITRDAHGGLQVGGQSAAVDWLVQMRRLPMDRTLDHLIRAGELRDDEVDRLASHLAEFYRNAEPVAISAEEYRRRLERHVLGNRHDLLDETRGMPHDLVQRIHQAQIRCIKLSPLAFDERVCAGRIIDGHGDLKPEHICLETPPVVFDCLEFNAELRQVDVADELAFLAMECEYLGAEQIGRRVLEQYVRATDDRPMPGLLAFYKAYRACVRAKVCALRAAQETDPRLRTRDKSAARKYLGLADRQSRELGQPLLVLVGGLMGTGKSTLARALAEELGSDVLQTDVIRQERLGASPRPANFGADHYRREQRQRVYDELFEAAREIVSTDRSVVLDGSFLDAAWREQADMLARRKGAAFLAIRCVCPPDEARRRIRQRAAEGTDASEARVELYDQQRAAEDQPFAEAPRLEVDTTAPLRDQVAQVIEALADVTHPLAGALPESST